MNASSESNEIESARPVRADAMERASSAYLARLNGGTWRQVAEVSGFADESGARRAVENFVGATPAPDREAQRYIVREQTQMVVRQALQDVRDKRPGAVTAAVRVLDLQMRLDGLAEPARLQVDSPTAAEIEDLVDRIFEATGHSMPVEKDIFADFDDAVIVADDLGDAVT